MRLKSLVIVIAMLLVSLVLQTTLITRTSAFVPDLVMLIVILVALTRMRSEAVLTIAFFAGLSVDLLGSAVLGLRALVLTVVAYLAIRTRERADIGRIVTAFWGGMVTFAGVVLLLLVGTLFGQSVLLGDGVVDLLILVPVANTILAWLFAPMVVRAIDRDATAFRYA